ncbi:hypothetical protein O3P69_002652 [Scylla paramamosain]|uniref:Uncharacterized protein n=1 Tax=Scylla paramamosain TaxID=85552 RepID=A0AAW0ULU3_SCYPA
MTHPPVWCLSSRRLRSERAASVDYTLRALLCASCPCLINRFQSHSLFAVICDEERYLVRWCAAGIGNICERSVPLLPVAHPSPICGIPLLCRYCKGAAVCLGWRRPGGTRWRRWRWW